MNEKELFNKINEDKDYRSDILIDLNVQFQLLERYTYTEKNKISPKEYKLAVVSLEAENQELQQRIDKATNYYYKTLAEYEKENKQMPEESVMMFNLMEGNR